jgi:aspartate/methionine/tyrosine aminotransferase
MNKDLAVHVARLQTNSNSCTATFTQKAGIAALTGPQTAVEAMNAEFRIRRDTIVKGLNQIPGIKALMPQGAFYVFPNITGTGMTSKQLADALLEEAGVACLAGTSFGAHGEGYLRLSYANSLENLQLALQQIGEFLSVRTRA